MRLSLLIILTLGVFLAPWWLMTTALLLSVVVYRRFYLALIPAVLMDVMHGGAHLIDEPLSSVTLLVSISLLVVSYTELYLREHVRV